MQAAQVAHDVEAHHLGAVGQFLRDALDRRWRHHEVKERGVHLAELLGVDDGCEQLDHAIGLQCLHPRPGVRAGDAQVPGQLGKGGAPVLDEDVEQGAVQFAQAQVGGEGWVAHARGLATREPSTKPGPRTPGRTSITACGRTLTVIRPR